MSGFLLDTNCISELVRADPSRAVLDWFEAADESLLYLSVLTFGEIRKGIAGVPSGTRRAKLETWLQLELRTRFAGRILPIDGAVADRWGILAAAARKIGKNLSAVDGLLAATALQHNLSMVTRNITDFAITQVQVMNPWET